LLTSTPGWTFNEYQHSSKPCPLALTLKDDTTNDKRTEKDRQNANASAKSKELHPHLQSQPNAAHLLLPQPLTKPDKE